MTKLYYTDPLKAAWMAREFGVKFEQDNFSQGRDWLCGSTLYHGDAPYFIHPDSLSIFEPMEGDLVYCHPTDVYEIWRDEKFEPTVVHKSFADLGDIVTRNGKAFFMPETKA